MNARIWLIFCAATLFVVARAAESPTAAPTDAPAAPAAPKADSNIGVSVSTTTIANAPSAAQPATTTPSSDSTLIGPVLPAITNVQPGKVVRAPAMSLSPLLDQVVRMSERGTDETVLTAYIDSAPAYRITGNEIIQLQDLGVSQPVILALVQRSKEVGTTAAAPPQADAATVAPSAPANAAPAVVQPPATPPADYTESLAPYGTWYDVPGYGYSWQPTVAVINTSWRPYCDYGNWAWTDYGWYWNSYYSWGWAPFHYGRWYSHPHHGWLWCPDNVWGPAWVSWSYSGSYCGWAALPPGACFTAGIGWTHHGIYVGAHHGFGLHHSDYTYVHHNDFANRHVGRSAVGAGDAGTIHRGSTVNNNHTMRGERVVNTGIPRSSVGGAGGGNAAIRSAAAPTISPRGTQPAGGANVGRSTIAGRSAAPAGSAALSTRPAIASGSRPAAPVGNANAGAFANRAAPSANANAFANRAAPAANTFARRSAPVQPAMRQQSPVQVAPRQAAPRYSPQPMARVAPSQASRYGGGSPVYRSAPTRGAMPRYSAPAAAPRQFSGSPGRSYGSAGSRGGVSRGTIAGGGSRGGGGMQGGGGRR